MKHKTFLRSVFYAALCLVGLSLNANVQAATLSFYCITNTSSSNCTTGQAQFTVDVSAFNILPTNTSGVLFWFKNTGANASSITDIYFDDGSLLNLAGLIDKDQDTNTYAPTYVGNTGVDFTQQVLDKVSPSNLPGGKDIADPFIATGMFMADSDSPVPVNGINPGEALGIFFTLQGSQTYSNVISELASGQLRVGIHTQAFASGNSVSLVNNPVPVPAAAWLFGSGLLSLLGIARRRQGKKI